MSDTLSEMIYLSFSNGHFADALKNTNITPLFKTGDNT